MEKYSEAISCYDIVLRLDERNTMAAVCKGLSLGEIDGDLDGLLLGDPLGELDGDMLGLMEGDWLGLLDGDRLGLIDGDRLGL